VRRNRRLACAETVDQDAYRYAASGRPDHRVGYRLAGRIVLEDITFEMDVTLRTVDRPDQCREVLGTAVQQGQPVARQKPSGHRIGADTRRAW